MITTWHRKDDVLGKVHEVVNGLGNCVQLKAGNRKVVVWVRKAVKTMLQHDRGSLLLLGDHTIDRKVGQETLIA